MQQKILEFIVDDQFIRAPHYTVVADSKDYLVARFSFSEQWQGLVKTAVFQGADGKAYFVVLDKDTCPIPAEVIQPTRFLVSVFGGDRLTTDRAMVEVAASGFTTGGITPPVPTPDVYNQLMEAVSTDRQLAQAAATTATEKAEQCVALTASAESLLQNAENASQILAAAKKAQTEASASEKRAWQAAQQSMICSNTAALEAKKVETSCVNAANSATDAATQANIAQTFSEDAKAAAAQAESAAENAKAAANAANPEWQLLETVDITEPTEAVSLSFPGLNLKELYFEGTVHSQDRTTLQQNFSIGITRSTTIWSANGTFGHASYPSVMTRGHVFLSPSGTLVCDATVSLYGYALDGNGKSFTATGRFTENGFTNASSVNGLYLKVAGGFAAGTSFKIWGR